MRIIGSWPAKRERRKAKGQSPVPPVSMKVELRKTGCYGGFVAQPLWWLQPDTLGASPSAANSLCRSISNKSHYFLLWLLSLCAFNDFSFVAYVEDAVHD